MDDQIPETSRTTRSMFLAAGVAGATLAVVGCGTTGTATAANDRAEIEAVLHRPAKHKQVIGAVKIDGAAALRYAGNGLNAFQFAFGEGAGTLHVVCVMYGTSVVFAANDTLWGKYRLFDVLDSVGDPLPAMIHTPQNPFYKPRSAMSITDAPDDPRGYYHDFSVAALTKRGVSFFVCNNALTELTRHVATAQGGDPAGIYADFQQNLVPGAMVVPSGVASIVLAQEAGFTFLPG